MRKVANAAQLLQLLSHPKIDDLAQLTRLLNHPKVQDGTQLLALLGQPKLTNAHQLETLLAHVKITRGAELLTLLSDIKVTDSSQLASLLLDTKIAHAAELMMLCAHAPSAAQIAQLLTIHPSGNALLAYLSLNVTQRLQTVLLSARVVGLTLGQAIQFSPPNLALATAEWITLGVGAGISGPQALLNLINRGWAISDIRAILTQAHIMPGGCVANGPDNNEMTCLLAWAALYDWPAAQVNPFIAHVIRAVALGHVNPAPPWTTVLNWVDTFRQHHVGPPGPMPAQVLLHTTDYPGPPLYRVRAYRRPTNMNHYYRGHSFEHFSFTPKNINRTRFSSFWPLGTSFTIIQAQIDARAREPAAIMDANHATLAPSTTQSSNIDDFRVGFKFWRPYFNASLGYDVYDVELNQFFPDPALTHLTIHKDVLKGIKALLNK